MTYITPAQAAARHGVSARRIQILAKQGRIPGAKKFSGVWLIPDTFRVSSPVSRISTLQKITF